MHSPRAGSTPLVTFTVRPAPPATRSGPRMVWLPAAAMALSTAIAAGAGVVLGVLAATQVGPGRTQWLAVVQAHGAIQQWSWLAVFTAALVFEFIVPTTNFHPLLIELSFQFKEVAARLCVGFYKLLSSFYQFILKLHRLAAEFVLLGRMLTSQFRNSITITLAADRD